MTEIMHRVKSLDEIFKGYKTDKKIYNVGIIGNFEGTRRKVEARSMKEAKKIFADYVGVNVSSYIVARAHDVVSLNDHRPLLREMI